MLRTANHKSNQQPQRRPQQKRIGIVTALLLLFSGVVLLTYFVFYQASARARTFVREFNQAVTALEQAGEHPGKAILQAQQHLLTAREALETFRPMASLLITGPTNEPIDLPGLRQLAAWWIFADEASLAAQELLEAARLSTASLEEDHLAKFLSITPELQLRLQAADGHLHQAQAIRPLLDPTWLPNDLTVQAETALVNWDTLVPIWAERLPQIDRLLGVLPAALGSHRPVTYLVMIQSSDNLRATGGFLTGVGTIRLEQGRITKVMIRDVTEKEFWAQWSTQAGYTTPRITPPDPLRRYMGLGHWLLRDGNWWADFPTTVQQVLQFWQLVDQTPIDGVIGLTDQGIVTILAATGPISLGNGQTLTADNMKVMAAQRIFGEPDPEINQESAFFQEVALHLVAGSERLSLADWSRLVQHLETAGRRHDLMVTSFDPTLASAFHELGIDGAIHGQQDDYFYLVEDNLADSKLNSFVRQSLKYEIQLEADGRPGLASLTIDKINAYTLGTELVGFPKEGYNTGGRWDAQTQQWDKWEGYYGGYLRLFPPPASQFLEATGFDDPVEVMTESDRSIFGSYVGMWAGTQRQLQFRWLSGGQPSTPGQYRLFVQRQPGTLVYPLTVQVYLPNGYQATAITPTPVTVSKQIVIWQVFLDQDQTFSLRLTQ